MALITPQQSLTQHPTLSIHSQQTSKVQQSLSRPSAVLRASLAGGAGLVLLTLIGLLPSPANLPPFSLAIIIIPGYLMACLVTGLLANSLAGHHGNSSQQSSEIGWMAGFWAGIFSGIAAMSLAARGVLLSQAGDKIAALLPALQPEIWSVVATPENMALAGRVLAALIIYGILGALITALISSIGGLIYFELSSDK